MMNFHNEALERCHGPQRPKSPFTLFRDLEKSSLRRRHKLSVKEYIRIVHVGKKVPNAQGLQGRGRGWGVSQTESMPVPGQRSRTSRDLPTGQENDVPGCEMKSATLG